MNPKLEETKHALAKSDFVVEAVQALDEAHAGNWILVASRGPLVVRIASDRGDIQIDLMPYHRFAAGVTEESDWYNWDVVAQALGLQIKNDVDTLTSFLHESGLVESEFQPDGWEETLPKFRSVEKEKRRRLMEGQSG
ncbi:MAG TPA: hypothetical protein VN952_08790 [Chthoniobacterales bacterium]|jgi:hypothetical protein|nr:hypothetical protein [Chthoniobacterales bacterium]